MKALTCLERNEATPADVYIFWHAVVGATRDVLVNPHSQFPIEVQDEIFGIFQKRHNQVFGEGNLSSSAMLYLAAVYLHPRKCCDSLYATCISFNSLRLSAFRSIPR